MVPLIFRQNRERVRIPFDQRRADLDLSPFFDFELRAVDDRVALFLAALFVHDRRARRCGSSQRAHLPDSGRSAELWNLMVPAFFASRLVCSATRLAVPPIWNVRIVSCVPGSPIDCAAITPTASPISTSFAGRQIACRSSGRRSRDGIRTSTPSGSSRARCRPTEWRRPGLR